MGVSVLGFSAFHPHSSPPPSEGEGKLYIPLSAHRGGRDFYHQAYGRKRAAAGAAS